MIRGSALSRVWTASPGENPPAGLPTLPVLLHPAHPRAVLGAPQKPLHLLISINYAQVGARGMEGAQSEGFDDAKLLSVSKTTDQPPP